jgi:hypothetical protein
LRPVAREDVAIAGASLKVVVVSLGKSWQIMISREKWISSLAWEDQFETHWDFTLSLVTIVHELVVVALGRARSDDKFTATLADE